MAPKNATVAQDATKENKTAQTAQNGKVTDTVTSQNPAGNNEQPRTENAPALRVNTKPAQETAPTLLDKVATIQDQYDKCQRLEKLRGLNEELDNYRVSSDGMRQRLILVDETGREFKTFNSDLIVVVISACKAHLLDKTRQTEAEIMRG